MSIEAAFTLGVLVLATVGLALEITSPDVLLMGALAAATATGVIDLETALQGFANATLLALGPSTSWRRRCGRAGRWTVPPPCSWGTGT